MQSLDESQSWCHDPGPSLWDLIAEHVPGSELPNICTALGHFLVDMYTEVHAEAEMWYRMWQDSQRSGCPGSRETRSISSLPDPPVIKELLRAEVKMLLKSLEERASSRGGDGEQILLKYKPETVSYVLGHTNNFSSNGIKSENAADGSRPSSHCSVRSCAEEEIEAVRDKINVSDIDQVVDRLKSVLMEECEALNKMVQSFKISIKEYCRSQRKWEKPEPSLRELRELREIIQTDLDCFSSSSSLQASPQPTREKSFTNKLRLSAEPGSDQTLQDFPSSLDRRPHPPSAPLHPEPGQSPLSNTSTTFAPIRSPSFSRTQSQHGITLNKLKRITGYTTFASSRLPPTNHIDDKRKSHCSSSPMYITTNPPCRPQTSHTGFQVNSQNNSPIPRGGPPPHTIHHSSSKHNLIQRETPFTNCITPLSTAEVSTSEGAADNCNKIQNLFTSQKLETQNRRKKKVHKQNILPLMQENGDGKRSNGDHYRFSVTSEISTVNKNDHPRKDFIKQQSHMSDPSSHYSGSGEEQVRDQCALPMPELLNGQYVTFSNRRVEDTKLSPIKVSESLTKPELINTFLQPVPPSRLTT